MDVDVDIPLHKPGDRKDSDMEKDVMDSEEDKNEGAECDQYGKDDDDEVDNHDDEDYELRLCVARRVGSTTCDYLTDLTLTYY
jgi:hypothetical protein